MIAVDTSALMAIVLNEPEALNFGDCFACEVAKEHGCRLLYVGEDFARTDLGAGL